MTMSILSPHERALLAGFASRTREAKALRRAQALLWLDQGESLGVVATRLDVTRQTVYNPTTSLECIGQICPRRIAALRSQATRESRFLHVHNSLC